MDAPNTAQGASAPDAVNPFQDAAPEKPAEPAAAVAAATAEPTGGQASEVAVGAAGPSDTEAKLNHYKKLITQSRTMLQNYQKQVAEKEREKQAAVLETTDLRTKLQRAEAVALKASQELLQVKQQAQQQASAGGNGGGNSSAGNSGGASANRRPARALRRVEDGEGGSWLLFEFEGGVREWRRFSDEVAIADFIRRDSGEPIALPAASLSPEESRATQMEAEAAVARITDEFRRYRVKAEVSRKQRDAEVRQAKHAAVAEQQRRIDGQGGGSISGGGGSGLDGSGGGSGGSNSRNALEEQLLTLQEESEAQAAQLRSSMEALQTEIAQLKANGAEATLAMQWRERYDAVSKEKAELVAKLKAATRPEDAYLPSPGGANSPYASGSSSSGRPPPSPSAGAGGGPDSPRTQSAADMARRFNELREEYRMYRKRAMEALAEKEVAVAHLSGRTPNHAVPSLLTRSSSTMPDDPKLQYLKNLMLKYLCTDEGADAKDHMERAITTILQFTEAERSFVAERRADASAAWLTNWLPTNAIAGAPP